MDLQDVTSINELESLGGKIKKIFVEESQQFDSGTFMGQSQEVKRKKKKITVIKKVRHRDGSVDRIKHQIFKNYGAEFARNMQEEER